MIVKTLLIFIIAVGIGIIGTIAFLIRPVPAKPSVVKSKQTTPTPTPYSLDIAPSDSLVASVATFSGELLWQSRSATQAARVSELTQVKQGELIETNDTEDIHVQLQDITLTLSANSSLEFIQTLPTSIVLAQKKGTVVYSNATSTTPISIRSLHLLIQQLGGDATITINDEEKTAEILVETGEVTIAFNDADNVSTIVTIPAGKQLFFDDETRTTRLGNI